MITSEQAELYRMVSGDFEGLTTAEAAERLGTTPQSINRKLKAIEEAAPSLFPLVTKQEAEVEAMYERAGMSVDEIAIKLGVTESRVYQVLKSLEIKGRLAPIRPVGRILSYDSKMDAHVKERF